MKRKIYYTIDTASKREIYRPKTLKKAIAPTCGPCAPPATSETTRRSMPNALPPQEKCGVAN